MEVLKRPILLLEGTKVVLERHPCFLEESYQGFGSAFFLWIRIRAKFFMRIRILGVFGGGAGIYILAISPPPWGGGKIFVQNEKQGRI